MAGMGFGGMEAMIRAEQEAELNRRLERQAEAYEAELQAAKDRASTSYREGYEAGRVAYAYETRNSGPPGVLLGVKLTLEEIKAAAERARIPPGPWEDAQERVHEPAPRPVLASNHVDPKCASIFEAAEMMADLTGAMRNLADALEKVSASREHYRRTAWEQDAEIDKWREQIRVVTQERNEWAATAARRGDACDDLKRQLGETQEALGKATERADQAEALLWRRS